jgi:cobalamin biosynthetic protein CobC
MKLVDGLVGVEDHGGSLGRARRLFPLAPEPWVDLSTGINPHSYPLFDLPATAFTRLPEPGRAAHLCAVAAQAYGVSSAACVVAAPGTQMLLPQVMRLVPPGRAKVLGPTYAEHARAASLAGHQVVEVRDFGELYGADIAIVVNPNNPDGRTIERPALLDLAARLADKGGLLVVDEAFMDVGPIVASVSGDAGIPGLVVLRSFGKFFGMAGIRLGFALSNQKVTGRISSDLGPWAVSGPALEIGIRALADIAWQDVMRGRLAGDAARLDGVLERAGASIAGGTSLYRFVELAGAPRLFTLLGQAGVLVRNFSWNASVLRIGLPADEAAWRRLEEALTLWENMQQANMEETAS